jgi:TPR repeat protein
MSFRFLFWTFASCLIISGVVGWLFFGERGVDPEEQALLAYEVSLNAERRSAERGGVEDWTRYARSLVTGSASLRNPKSAMQWYRKAADQGYPAAQVGINWLCLMLSVLPHMLKIIVCQKRLSGSKPV